MSDVWPVSCAFCPDPYYAALHTCRDSLSKLGQSPDQRLSDLKSLIIETEKTIDENAKLTELGKRIFSDMKRKIVELKVSP